MGNHIHNWCMGHEENQYVEKKIADKISYTLKKQKERNNSAII